MDFGIDDKLDKGLKMMSNKKACFDILDRVPVGKRFYSTNLTNVVRGRTGNKPFVSTCLRYLRLWNILQLDKKAVCIDKAKSLYQVVNV